MGLREFGEKRAIRSEKTAQCYVAAVRQFGKSLGKEPDEIIQEIKSSSLDPYEVLNRFIADLSKRGRAPKTILGYTTAVRRFFGNESILLEPELFKSKVVLPDKYNVSTDRIPTHQELREILLRSPLKTKALISLLSTSGLRIGECSQLKIGSFDFESNPGKVTVPAKVAKKRKGRTVFIASETVELLKSYLGSRVANKDEYLWPGTKTIPLSEGEESRWKNREELDPTKPQRINGLADLIERAVEKAGLRHKMDSDSPRYQIHVHCFRKYFFTNCLAAGIDRGIAEAWMGHKFMLDESYLRLKEKEIAKEYLKAVPAFTFLSASNGGLREKVRDQTQEIKDLQERLSRLEAVSSEKLKIKES